MEETHTRLPAARANFIGAAAMKVDRRQVTEDELTTAEAVLARWNLRTGQQLTSVDWIRKIIARVREHPTLTVNDHEAVIAANLAKPWWTGPATPSVVYGNAAQFERAMLQATHTTTTGGQGAFDVAMSALEDDRP